MIRLLASRSVLNNLNSKNVEKVAILGRINDPVEQHGSDGNMFEIEKNEETLYKNENKNANFQVVLRKIIGRSGKKISESVELNAQKNRKRA